VGHNFPPNKIIKMLPLKLLGKIIIYYYTETDEIPGFFHLLKNMAMLYPLFFFLGAGPSIPYWDYHGSTFISTSYIRLTPDHQSKAGGLWNSVVGIPDFFFNLTSNLSKKAR